MSGNTVVRYGGVTLRHVATQSIEQTPVMDPSGTDLLCWKFTVKVSGLVHGKGSWCQWATPLAGANPSGTNSTDALIGCRAGLPPRQSFQMWVGNTSNGEPNGSVLLYATPMPNPPPSDMTYCDVKNGPFCTRFAVNKVAGGDVYHVEAEFEIHKLECDKMGLALDNTRGVLSHRWMSQDSLDTNRRLSRHYSGTLILASANYNAAMFRSLVVPPLQPRMRRENITFTVTEDGLNLRYSFTDVQVAQSAPAPASFWELTVSNSLTVARIMRREVSGVLVAPDDDGQTTAADLLLLAWYIIGAKVHNKAWTDPGIQVDSALLESATFTEQIGERTALSFSATFQLFEKFDAGVGDQGNGFFSKLGGWINSVTGLFEPENPLPDPGPQGAGLADFSQRIVGFIGVPLRDDLLPEGSRPYNPLRSEGGREQSDGNGGILLDGNGNPAIETPPYANVCGLATLFAPYLQSPCSDTHALIADRNASTQSDANGSTASGPQSGYPVYVAPELPVEDTSFFTDAHTRNPYSVWKMSSTVKTNAMRAAMPIAKEQPSSTSSSTPPVAGTKIVKLGPSQVRRVVRIEAQRVGKWPELPDLEKLAGFSSTDAGAGHPGPTQKLLKSRQLFAVPEVAATGQLMFTVGVEAIYAMDRAPLPDEMIPVGRQIWNTTLPIVTRPTATNSAIWATNEAISSP